MSEKSRLERALSQGKTDKVFNEMLRFTSSDAKLNKKIIALWTKYQQHLSKKKNSAADEKALNVELIQINRQLQLIIAKLPMDEQIPRKSPAKTIALWISIFAAVVGITGYTLKDFLQKKKETTASSVFEKKELPDSTKSSRISNKVSKAKVKQRQPIDNSKINVVINGKVGNFINADTGTIYINQQF